MTISTESFLKEPSKYFRASQSQAVAIDTEYGGAAILSAEEYEELDTMRCIQEGFDDIDVGRVLTHEEVFGHLDETIKNFTAQNK